MKLVVWKSVKLKSEEISEKFKTLRERFRDFIATLAHPITMRVVSAHEKKRQRIALPFLFVVVLERQEPEATATANALPFIAEELPSCVRG
jgi:hypothetical protein